jgi:hypothetical protein
LLKKARFPVTRAFLFGMTIELLALPVYIAASIGPIQSHITLVCIQTEIAWPDVQTGVGYLPQNNHADHGRSQQGG